MRTLWTEPGLTADVVPGSEGVAKQHGIHAIGGEGAENAFLTRFHHGSRELRAFGAVELWGTLQVHADGIVRAEHCRILALRVAPTKVDGGCACGRLLIVRDPRDQRSSGDYLKLRRLCAASGECGTASLHPGLERVGETTIPAVASALRQRYEVPALPVGEGPWQKRRTEAA